MNSEFKQTFIGVPCDYHQNINLPCYDKDYNSKQYYNSTENTKIQSSHLKNIPIPKYHYVRNLKSNNHNLVMSHQGA